MCIPVGTHGVDEELTDADTQQVGATHRLVGEVLLVALVIPWEGREEDDAV